MRKAMMMVVAAAMLFTANASKAADQHSYGAAGCGLGSMIFGNQKGAVQIFAATTNGILANQTFGITTGTLNCGDAMIGQTASAKAFIETNREALAKDISRGQGETVKNLATIAGCSDASAVGVSLQKNFSQIFPNEKVPSEQVSDSILSTLKTDKSLSCAKLG